MWLKAPPLDVTKKKRYINTIGEYSGQIWSWDFDERHRLIMINRTDIVQYFKAFARYPRILLAHDLHHLA
ncbi:hypothetical protein Hanom_Chr08g00749261 [Helianthus anomalus]